MPFEFCEWNPLFKKCKETFAQNWSKHFPDVEGEEELLQLMTRLGFEGGDANSKKAQSTKKAAAAEDGGAVAAPKSKKEKAPPEVVIDLNNRNKKKHITIVKGLEAFEVDTAAAAKVFGKKVNGAPMLVRSTYCLPRPGALTAACNLSAAVCMRFGSQERAGWAV